MILSIYSISYLQQFVVKTLQTIEDIQRDLEEIKKLIKKRNKN